MSENNTAVVVPTVQDFSLPHGRHRGQRVQTVKNVYTQIPIQYRKALDMLRQKTRKTLKEVLIEAIADCAVKHELVVAPADIRSWPDWD